MTRRRFLSLAAAAMLLVGWFARFERDTTEFCALCGTMRNTSAWGFGAGDALWTVAASERVHDPTASATLYGPDHRHVWRVDSLYWSAPFGLGGELC
jgi:hypothetical protein